MKRIAFGKEAGKKVMNYYNSRCQSMTLNFTAGKIKMISKL